MAHILVSSTPSYVIEEPILERFFDILEQHWTGFQDVDDGLLAIEDGTVEDGYDVVAEDGLAEVLSGEAALDGPAEVSSSEAARDEALDAELPGEGDLDPEPPSDEGVGDVQADVPAMVDLFAETQVVPTPEKPSSSHGLPSRMEVPEKEANMKVQKFGAAADPPKPTVLDVEQLRLKVQQRKDMIRQIRGAL